MAAVKSHVEAANLLRELSHWSLNSMTAMKDLRELKERIVILTGREDVLPDLPAGALDLRLTLEEILEVYMETG